MRTLIRCVFGTALTLTLFGLTAQAGVAAGDATIRASIDDSIIMSAGRIEIPVPNFTIEVDAMGINILFTEHERIQAIAFGIPGMLETGLSGTLSPRVETPMFLTEGRVFLSNEFGDPNECDVFKSSESSFFKETTRSYLRQQLQFWNQ